MKGWLISVASGGKPGTFRVVSRLLGWQGSSGRTRNCNERQRKGDKLTAARGCAPPSSPAERIPAFLSVHGAKLEAQT